MSDPHLDLFSVAVLLLATLVGPALAPAVAAYIIIGVGALIGTLPALKARSPSNSPGGTLLFVVVLVTWSCGITVTVSLLIQQHTGVGYQWLLFPVAFGISAIGERWLEAPALVWERVKRAGMALRPKGAGGDQGGQP